MFLQFYIGMGNIPPRICFMIPLSPPTHPNSPIILVLYQQFEGNKLKGSTALILRVCFISSESRHLLKTLHTIGKVSLNASILYNNQEICNKTNLWKFQLISLFLLQENSKNAFSIFAFYIFCILYSVNTFVFRFFCRQSIKRRRRGEKTNKNNRCYELMPEHLKNEQKQ